MEVERVLIDDTLRDLEEEFGDRVVRIHRNALVMMDHLEGLEREPCGHYQVRMRGVEERLGCQQKACFRSTQAGAGFVIHQSNQERRRFAAFFAG